MSVELSSSDENSQKITRQPYNTPFLLTYGSVAELTQSGPTGVSEGGGSSSNKKSASSRDMKENITAIGRHPLGFGLYLFDYKAEFRGHYGYGRQFGVMIDEVVNVVPAAVGIDESGYPVVDYSMLGIHRPKLH